MKKRSAGVRIVRFFIGLLILIFLLGTVSVIAVGGYLGEYDAPIDASILDMTEKGGGASKLYAMSDGEYSEIDGGLYGSVKYKYVSVEQCPENLKNAFIAIEDKRFWKHSGVDVLRASRAVFNYLKGESRSFGASTITQQLIKNLTGRDEYTLERKFSEMLSALELEKSAHKEQILGAYLNVINLARGCRGVGAAAEFYFGSDVADLSLRECAAIAAITNNPSVYDPISHPENNDARARVILSEMLAQGYIEETEYLSALSEKLVLADTDQNSKNKISSWYADMVAEDVISDMCERLGYTRAEASLMVYNGGLKIYTSMDKTVQAELEKYYENEKNFPNGGSAEQPQSAMIVTDRHTGAILGVVGAVGKKTGNRIQNYATDTRRSPGSAIKPLSVYAPALELKRINWSTVFDDSPVKFTDGNNGERVPWPKNADGKWRGDTTVRDALVRSVNTVSVRTLEMVGMDASIEFMKDKLHFDSLGASDKTLSALALGQTSHGVSMREVVGGYSVFNDGVYREPISYTEVYDSEGRLILKNEQIRHTAISRDNACIMTQMLKGVVSDGTAKDICLCTQKGIEVAGKTGTTQNNCDRWFVGYTPDLVAAVWMGYDYPAPLDSIKGNPCVRIWDEVMFACAEARNWNVNENFELSRGVMKLTYCRDSGKIPNSYCEGEDENNFKVGYFTADNMPTEICDLHKATEEKTETENIPEENDEFFGALPHIFNKPYL